MSAYLPYQPRLRTTLSATDLLGLALAGSLGFLLRFAAGPRSLKVANLLAGPGLIVWAVVTILLLAAAAELYEPEVILRRREVVIRVLVVAIAWSSGIAIATWAVTDWTFGRGLLAITVAAWSTWAIAARWVYAARLRRRPRFPVLVVGSPQASAAFCAELEARPNRAPWRPLDGSALAGNEIAAAIESSGATIVVLAGTQEHATEMSEGLSRLHFSGVPVVAASEVWAWLEERLPLEAMSPALFLHQPGFGAVHWTLFNRLTRVADIVLSAMLLALAAPLFALGALTVYMLDGGPVMFRQQRVGQFGRIFVLLKLRTMRCDAEPDGPTFATPDDPRLIPGGRWLRRFRLDELPQLVNVLRGEMSLVGPRPERPEFVEALTREIPFYGFRTAVPPGLTGWAQVNCPYASALDGHRRKLEYDLYFIRERSLRLYLLTLLRTASAALVGVPAERRSALLDTPTESETAALDRTRELASNER